MTLLRRGRKFVARIGLNERMPPPSHAAELSPTSANVSRPATANAIGRAMRKDARREDEVSLDASPNMAASDGVAEPSASHARAPPRFVAMRGEVVLIASRRRAGSNLPAIPGRQISLSPGSVSRLLADEANRFLALQL